MIFPGAIVSSFGGSVLGQEEHRRTATGRFAFLQFKRVAGEVLDPGGYGGGVGGAPCEVG